MVSTFIFEVIPIRTYNRRKESGLEEVLNTFDGFANGRLILDAFFDHITRVQDRGVVATAKVSPDFLETQAGVLSGEINGDVARASDGTCPAGRFQILNFDIEMLHYGGLDGFDGEGIV